MLRTLFLKGLLGALLATALGCGGSGPPSIVMITIDTLRADHLGCYGYFRDTSPTIDALARDGVLFENAVATVATTLPSHTSLMTSSYLARHGVRGNFTGYQQPVPLDSGDLRTFAQELRQRGYATAAFTSVVHLRPETGITAGFETFGGVPAVDSRESDDRTMRAASVTTAEAVRWLERDAREPFFLWVHYFDPHSPYDPPGDYAARYRTGPRLVEFMHGIGIPQHLMAWSAERHNLYDGEIRYTDDQIGRLLSVMRRLHLYDPAAIILTAEHGEGLGQHGVAEHSVLYQEGIRIPLILKLPHIAQAGVRSRAVVSMIDVVPTVISTLGLAIPTEPFDGIDVLSERREFALAEREHSPARFGTDESMTLTGARWKYEFHTEQDDALYDLQSDPHELSDVLASNREVADRMRAEALELVKLHAERGARLELKHTTSPGMREALESLGYVE